MDPLMPSASQDSVEKFLDVPYNQRWECLKPVIVRVYIEENNKLANLSRRMEVEYSFNAQVHQYRYQFKKWGIKKRTVAEEKEAVITALGKRRLQDGTSTSDALINQGDFQKSVDKKQLKRYINQSIRENEQITWTPGLFLRHDLPYAALFRRSSGNDNPSPSVIGPTTPDFVDVKSPHGGPSPSASHNSLSPTMQLIQKKVLFDRAIFFLSGREDDLLAQLDRDEKKSTATWLHDFWMYSFMTAKYWGRGPKTWTFSLINFKSFAKHLVPPTPDHHITFEETSESSSSTAIVPPFDSPTQLCRWTIHHEDPEYEDIPSPPSQSSDEPDARFDIDDESTWSQWRTDDLSRDLASTIGKGLQENAFSAIQPESLPLDANSIVKAVERSPKELEAEGFSFAIISRNRDAIYKIARYRRDRLRECYSDISPFHLAARFLDGGKTCCMVMDVLLTELDDSLSIGVNYIDKSGLTVLDTLFVTIIRSHSTVPPQTLGNAFTGQTRYPGQEVDPCGRWDADSPCIRHLYASGEPAIPSQWKHMFCHTSVQAICHCIASIFGVEWRPDINTPSGLFLKRCGHCGLELKVSPLHALVLTALCLANGGMPGENLFGIIACLVCLLTFRADPCATAKISISLLSGHDPGDDCQHPEINPAELAVLLFEENSGTWTSEIILGWKVLIAILQHDVAKRRDKPTHHEDECEDEEDDVEVCSHYIHEFEEERLSKSVYCGNQRLGAVWALIQAELLTYRRLNEDEPWLSPRFDMRILLEGLESDDDTCLQMLVRGAEEAGENLLQNYSRCGLFYGAKNPMCALREEACTSYYANLDDWERTTFIQPMEC
ncbi:uncharacterized protein F4807DRAFT_167323 [Annulohypoxylon truncatum]|uniref:uncharacterized protein n=1 Tax=Annulohypoxylon truncatum TaxID=327061 RepID=UPI002008EA31|nr:uncharacterized protein F4807DRAFT_167323 [Annulohypoxylon truncatum]KAI1207805.1 hypothetical protein F4807DRAFT_167323 [Annulohypoxylon truncatum]